MKEKYSLIRPSLILVSCTINILLAGIFVFFFGSPWGWLHATFAKTAVPVLLDFLALLQLLWFSFTLDQIFRYFFDKFNASLRSKAVPLVLAQLVSVFLYLLAALAAYLLLLQYPLTSLLAASGAVTLGIGYLFKNLIQDFVVSLQIQSDGLVAVNDWIMLATTGVPSTYQILDIDKHMVTLQQADGYRELIRNSIFYEMRLVNLSRQEYGSKRSVKITIPNTCSEIKVSQIFKNAINFLSSSYIYINNKHTFWIDVIEPAKTTFVLDYFSAPDKSSSFTDSLVKQTLLRFFKCAGVMCVKGIEFANDEYLHLTINQFAQVYLESAEQSLINRLWGVHQYSFLNALSSEELSELSKGVRLVHFNAGEKILKFGDVGDSLFIVSEGVVDVEVQHPTSSEKQHIFLWPGDCVGEMSLLTGEMRSADAIANQSCLLIRVDKDCIAPILEKNINLADALASYVLQRNNDLLSLQTDQEETVSKKKTLVARICAYFKLTVKLN